MITITTKELVKILNQFPLDTKVFLSSDSEGNSFSTLNERMSFEMTQNKKSIIIIPFQEGLEYDDLN